MPDPASAEDVPKELQIGGQAVIEGVVMRCPERWAVAVRRPDGEIHVEVNPSGTLAQRYPRFNFFPVRGVLALVDSLVIGVKSLSISASVALEAEGEEEEAEEARKFGMSGLEIGIALAVSLALFLGLFIALPAVIARLLQSHLSNTVLYNLVEGGIRIAIFVAYLAVLSFMPDVKRLYQYHGAEHMVVHAYEHRRPLTPEQAEAFSTAHMRCGTTFVVIVFVVSILVFSLMGRPALWLRILERIAIIPLVAAVSYEIIRLAGRWEGSRIVRAIMAPGLLFQRLTTRQPDQEQLAVAIRALEAAAGED